MTPEEMTFYLASLSLVATTIVALAKIYWLHINPNANGGAPKT